MAGETLRLSEESTNKMVWSMDTAIPDFVPVVHTPSMLGHKAHSRLEDLFGLPIASDDANPTVVDDIIGQKQGVRFGDIVGRQKEFVRNLPKIEAHITGIAAERGIAPAVVTDEMVEILTGSGIGKAMNRTLTQPLGDSYGTRQYIEKYGDQTVIIVRENIANWGARRHDRAQALLGSLSQKALKNVAMVVYAGSNRRYTGAELWRPELKPFITDDDGKETCSLTEKIAGRQIHAPAMRQLLESLGVNDKRTRVRTVGPALRGPNMALTPMDAVISNYENLLRDSLIVEVGNAPAGYVQLEGALTLQSRLGIDAGRQFVTTSDSVEIVRPDHFKALSPEGKSKVQNVETALNSFNGWLQTIIRVNQQARS